MNEHKSLTGTVCSASFVHNVGISDPTITFFIKINLLHCSAFCR